MLNSVIHSASARGMPVKPIAAVRYAAPAKMNAIMQLVRVAPISESTNPCQVSVPDHHDSASERNTPTTAASVAEASPP